MDTNIGLSGPSPTGTLTDCNLVLKGGVTSGLVHAGAVPELARRYRIRGVAGASAGAIAAAFVAAAELARSKGDAEGFARLQRCSADLPKRLVELIQPSPGFERFTTALIRLAPGTGQARVAAAVLCFWPALAAGALAGVGLWTLLSGWIDPVRYLIGGALMGVCGAAIALAAYLAAVVSRVARSNFGLCTGLSTAARPALTDWIHASLQHIAFGDEAPGPLTFGDLEAAGLSLKLVVTNLATGQAEITPNLAADLGFRPAEWARQLPQDVMAHLGRFSQAAADVQPIPAARDLPVLVAVRMSLACPGLMEATPAVAPGGGRVWFLDGGLTRNFPLSAFDHEALPTFAIDLDTIHPGQPDAPRARRFDPLTAADLPDLTTLRGFVWGLLVALREGHLRAEARTPGRQTRIYQARLRPNEGGMKLDMTAAEAGELMNHGQVLSALILETEVRPGP